MDFTCIGFDVRQWPWYGEFNADETGWEQNEDGYELLINKFELKENEYQLLDIQDRQQLLEVCQLVRKIEYCNLVAIQFPYDLVKLNDDRYGYVTASKSVDLSAFTCRGLDVCDFEGLFSVFHHPQIQQIRGTSRLINESELMKALELVQYANFIDKGHSPFVVTKVYSLK